MYSVRTLRDIIGSILPAQHLEVKAWMSQHEAIDGRVQQASRMQQGRCSLGKEERSNGCESRQSCWYGLLQAAQQQRQLRLLPASLQYFSIYKDSFMFYHMLLFCAGQGVSPLPASAESFQPLHHYHECLQKRVSCPALQCRGAQLTASATPVQVGKSPLC